MVGRASIQIFGPLSLEWRASTSQFPQMLPTNQLLEDATLTFPISHNPTRDNLSFKERAVCDSARSKRRPVTTQRPSQEGDNHHCRSGSVRWDPLASRVVVPESRTLAVITSI